ncbi:TIR domain-containing protein [Myceligenerans salitolerans]|uniref:TIR domain-containing protein n=1 Tax=Myceligenerans salitolerans TaxID=1230528 RepID=A0ABS3I5N8_9MICO|nr:TIR domain-containing protein [Myceligenerans salitolerans]MBO0608302.1 TIR domain-containing protein [Myceligenerans salitolerans]
MPDHVPPATPPARPRRKHYDAFLSYSRSAEGDFVPRVQAMLRGFGKGAAGPSDDRDLRLFVDRSGLAAHPHLWLEIKNCLAASDRLIVFASPGAAASEWVDKEVRWWLAERSIHTVYIALTSGEIVFDHAAGRIDAEATTALPPALVEHLDREPRWVDLRGPRRDPGRSNHPELPNALAELAAPLRNAAKEDVLSAHITAQRHLNRRARALTAALSVLLALSVVNGALASHSAEREAASSYESDAHLLAAASHASRAENPDLAQYLAAEAYHRAPGTQTRHAFLTATLDTPTDDQHLLRTVDTPGVTALAATGTGAVGRTATGGLLRWNPDDGDPEILPGAGVTLPDPGLATTSAVAGSDDGRVVAAIDAAGVILGRFSDDAGPLADDGELVRLYRPLLDVADDERLDPTAVAVTASGDALLVAYETRGTCPGGATHQLLRVALSGPEGDLGLRTVAARTHAFFASPASRCTAGDDPDDAVRAVAVDVAAGALRADASRRVVVADPRTGESRTLSLDTLAPAPGGAPDPAPAGTIPAPSLTTWAGLTGTGTATRVRLHHPLTRADDGVPDTMSCPVPLGWRDPELAAVDDAGARALVRTDDGLVACTAPRDMLWPRTRTWHLTGAAPGALVVLAPEDRVVAADGETLSLWRTTRESSDMDFPPGIADDPAAAPVVASRSGDRLPEHAATTALSWPDGTVQVHEKGTVEVPGLHDGERVLPVWLTPSPERARTTQRDDGDLLLVASDGRAWISSTDALRPGPGGTLDPPAEPLPEFRAHLREAHTAFTTFDTEGCLPRRLEDPESVCPVLVGAHRAADHLVLVDSTGGVYLLDPDLTKTPRYVPDELGIGALIASPWEERGRVAVDDDGHWLAVAPRGRSLRVLDLTSPVPGWEVRGGAMAQVHLVPATPGSEGARPLLVALAEDGSVRTGAVAEGGPLLPLLSPGSHGDVLAVLAEPGLVVRNEGPLLALFDIRSGARVGTIATSLRTAGTEPDPGTVYAAHGRLLLVQEHGVTISRALDKQEDTMLRQACVSAAPALTPEDLGRLGVRHTPPRCRIVYTEGLPTFTDPGLLVPENRLAPPPFPPVSSAPAVP